VKAALALALLLAAPLPASAVHGLPPGAMLAQVAALGGIRAQDEPAPGDITLRAAILDLYALEGAQPTPRGLLGLDASLAKVPASIQEPAARILAAMNEAARLRNEAFARVGVDDARFARDATLSGAPLSARDEARLADVLSRLDEAKMVGAARLVLDAVDAARVDLKAAVERGDAAGVSFVDPLRSVEIAGTGNDVHAEDRTLLIDLGGDDDWQDNAGAAMPDFVIQAFPGCVTTGALDCTPLSPDRNGPSTGALLGRACSADATQAPFLAEAYGQDVGDELASQETQASLPEAERFVADPGAPTQQRAAQLAASPAPDAGCLPQGPGDAPAWASDFYTRGILTDGDEHVVAVGLDLSGNDRFAPPKGFTGVNDGGNAAGCDTRAMGDAGETWTRNLTAGAAFAGIGVLWDDGGDDFYGGRSLTQGVGHVGGVGVLVDAGGDDRYSGVRLAQGAGIFGSVGLLDDEGGNDVYALENDAPFFNEFEAFVGCDVSTRDGQGRSNFDAVGALVDAAGDDRYQVQAHGAGVPGASRDDPATTQGSTGARLNLGPSPANEAAALGVGLLWDMGGHDAYSRPGRADDATDPAGTFVDQ